MAITVPHEIYSPDEGSPGNMVTQLGLMATSINNSLQTIPVKHIGSNTSNGRAYFGTGDGAYGDGQSYMGAIPESDTSTDGAFWFYSGSNQLFRLYKDVSARFYGDLRVDGDARVYGDLQVDGAISAGSDITWQNITLTGGWTVGGTNLPQVRVKNGVVYFKGEMVNSSFTGGFTTFGNLPANIPNPWYNVSGTLTQNSTAEVSGRVATTGALQVWRNSTSGAWANLSGLSYAL